MDELPIIIDVEASGFGIGSYPIEVGMVLPNKESHCLLIRPLPEWDHWDTEAEELHGISREILIKKGQAVEDVATNLNDLLDGETVYSDGWGNDMAWIALLFECANRIQRFKIEHLRSLITESQARIWKNVHNEVVKELDEGRHRASIDARILQDTYIRSKMIRSELAP